MENKTHSFSFTHHRTRRPHPSPPRAADRQRYLKAQRQCGYVDALEGRWWAPAVPTAALGLAAPRSQRGLTERISIHVKELLWECVHMRVRARAGGARVSVLMLWRGGGKHQQRPRLRGPEATPCVCMYVYVDVACAHQILFFLPARSVTPETSKVVSSGRRSSAYAGSSPS